MRTMAEKRMFMLNLITGDDFLDMTVGAQALYFHLCMRADDEGFLNNAQSIRKACQATTEDFDSLVTKGLLIRFESGIVCIRHWFLHNQIRADRFHETIYPERKQVHVVNGIYELGEEKPESGINKGAQPTRNQPAADAQPTRNQPATNPQPLDEVTAAENSIDKSRVDKNSIEKDSVEKKDKSNTDIYSPSVINSGSVNNLKDEREFSTLSTEDWMPKPESYKKTIPIHREGYS